jgi:hypothetical protein
MAILAMDITPAGADTRSVSAVCEGYVELGVAGGSGL